MPILREKWNHVLGTQIYGMPIHFVKSNGLKGRFRQLKIKKSVQQLTIVVTDNAIGSQVVRSSRQFDFGFVHRLLLVQKTLLTTSGFPGHPLGALESSEFVSRSNLIAQIQVLSYILSNTELEFVSPGLTPCDTNASRLN